MPKRIPLSMTMSLRTRFPPTLRQTGQLMKPKIAAANHGAIEDGVAVVEARTVVIARRIPNTIRRVIRSRSGHPNPISDQGTLIHRARPIPEETRAMIVRDEMGDKLAMSDQLAMTDQQHEKTLPEVIVRRDDNDRETIRQIETNALTRSRTMATVRA